MQYELTKTLHEKDLLLDQVKYLEEEIQRKTLEDRSFRSECSDKVHLLETSLTSARSEAENAAEQLSALKVFTRRFSNIV